MDILNDLPLKDAEMNIIICNFDVNRKQVIREYKKYLLLSYFGIVLSFVVLFFTFVNNRFSEEFLDIAEIISLLVIMIVAGCIVTIVWTLKSIKTVPKHVELDRQYLKFGKTEVAVDQITVVQASGSSSSSINCNLKVTVKSGKTYRLSFGPYNKKFVNSKDYLNFKDLYNALKVINENVYVSRMKSR